MKKLTICLILITVLLLPIRAGTAKDIYKWVDENGAIHFQDTPPQNVTKSVKIKSVPSYDDDYQDIQNSESVNKKPVLNITPIISEQPKKNGTPQIELYVTSWCPYCKKARDFFRSRGIPFTEYDIEKDRNAALRKQQLDKTSGVPFALINGKGVHGFSKAEYELALR